MSDTPRTDEAEVWYDGPTSYVKIEDMRQLERELAEARAEIEKLKLTTGELTGAFNARPKCEKCKHKDELVEQMRLSFSALLGCIETSANEPIPCPMSYACRAIQKTGQFMKAKSALSSAGRGESL